MNIYVETNFVLELVFEQEQHRSCEQILTLCEAGKARLILPAYCLAEPHETVTRRANNRKDLQKSLNMELRQLVRTASYTARIDGIRDITTLFVQSNEEEKQRFSRYHNRLLEIANIIPLTSEILKTAATFEAPYGLRPQDALVYASVITHLRQQKPPICCFLNRNSKDFDTPDIVNELKENHCPMIPNFKDGYNFMQKQTKP